MQLISENINKLDKDTLCNKKYSLQSLQVESTNPLNK